MSWDAVTAIAEVAGLLAVVISLIYVGVLATLLITDLQPWLSSRDA